MPPMNYRISSIFPPSNNDEFISPFTAPAIPNVRTQGNILQRPIVADSHIPRSPLPPEKLAKLANALGISAPLPKSTPPASATKRSFSIDGRATPESRAGTPTTVGRPTTSRYLIHVIPPKHFPFENRKDPEAFATFRRGTLVPLHATLQAQLAAIAREFQLPTSQGLVLFLVGENDSGREIKSHTGKGPRISEDVWKWLWTKVSDENPVLRGVGLGLSSGNSTPSEKSNGLRKLSSTAKLSSSPQAIGSVSYPLTPSPSTPSTTLFSGTSQKTDVTDEDGGSDEKQDRESASSPSSDFTTSIGDSIELDPRLLPGLGSPSMIPILAKVELDIDRKIGTWYETWCRSRRTSQKRKAKKVDAQGKLQLRITVNDKKGTISPPSSPSDDENAGYAQLSDSDDPGEREDVLTARGHKDPLADIFGTDKETWSDVQAERPDKKSKDDLALDGAALSGDIPEDREGSGVSDSEEVMALWAARNQSHLSRRQIPPPLNLVHHESDLEINVSTATPSPYYTDESTHLLYLAKRQDSVSSIDDGTNEKRLGGIYDDLELDLGADLDIEEQRGIQLKMREELDVLERNLAQFSPRALKSLELESVEHRSPTHLRLGSAPAVKTTFSPSDSPGSHRHVVNMQQLHPAQSSSIGPPNFRQPVLVGTPSPVTDTFPGRNGVDNNADGNVNNNAQELQSAWPAVPFTAISSRSDGDPLSPTSSLHSPKSNIHSPPRLFVNGKTNGTTSSSSRARNNSSISSMLSSVSGSARSETEARTRQYEEEAGFYSEKPRIQATVARRLAEASDSPVLPLSPDPFGRFPSSDLDFPERTSSLTNGSHERHISKTPSSRFSVDSEVGEELTPTAKGNGKSNIGYMKTIRKLWRKSNKASVSGGVGGSASPSPSPSPYPSSSSSMMPPRPFSSALSLRESDMDTISRTSTPSIPFPSGRASEMSMRGSLRQNKSRDRDSGLDPFYFDRQEPRAKGSRPPSPLAHDEKDRQQNYQFPRPAPTPASPRQLADSTSGGPTSPQAAVSEKKRGVRKSLVSKWKNGSEGGSSTDSGSEGRRRRPSILDMTASGLGLRRESVSTNGNSLHSLQSPSVPSLPAEYRTSQHSRGYSRGSVSNMLNMSSFGVVGDGQTDGSTSPTSPIRRKPVPQSSLDSSQESGEVVPPTPVSVVAPLMFTRKQDRDLSGVQVQVQVQVQEQMPRGGGSISGLTSPGGTSDGVRSSFDDSQFEIVYPRVGGISPAPSAMIRVDRDE